MLEIQSATKTYANGIRALDNISLSVRPGVFGLLGSNGAGKSSLMRTIATLQPPDEGTVTLNGLDLFRDPRRARRRIGYLPQDMGVYPRVTALEMLDYLAGLKGLKGKNRTRQVADLLERVNLTDAATRRLDGYSGGMRRRFGIAAAFLGSPDLVIVDEPTAGLDPAERRRFQFLLAEAARNCILILSSHIVEDLAGLCNDMALMKSGRIIAQGPPAALVSELDGQVWEHSAQFEDLAMLGRTHEVLSWRPRFGALTVRVLAASQPGEDFTPAQADLEDLYAASMRDNPA